MAVKKSGVDSSGLDFVTANRFYVGIESTISASFTEYQGLGVKVKYETYYEGGVNDQQRIFLGQPEFSEVTLKRGMTDDLVFWNWLNQVMKTDPKKAIKRRNVNMMVAIGQGSLRLVQVRRVALIVCQK